MDTDQNWMQCPPKDPNRNLRTNDIWQRPRQYLNKPHYNLSVADIEGAQPRPEKSNLGNRRVNPLNPTYSWSKVEPVPAPQPKFLRDTMDISDIWGAQPARCITYSCAQRDSMNFRDIERSYAGWNRNQYQRKKGHKIDAMNVRDINADHIGMNRMKRGNRCTNPLDPKYEYDHLRKSGLSTLSTDKTPKEQKRNILGGVKGSKSQILNPYFHRDEFNLRTNDIEGAQVNMRRWKRNNPRDPMFIGDIEKCAPNTKIKFKTRRCTNPLNPSYQMLDHEAKENNNVLQRNQSTPMLNKDNSKPQSTSSKKSTSKMNVSKSTAVLAPVITNNNFTSHNGHSSKHQGSASSQLTHSNLMKRYERQQQERQRQEDMESIKSLSI